MHRPTSTEKPSMVESSTSTQAQYSSHNSCPLPPGPIHPHVLAYGPPPPVPAPQLPPPPPPPVVYSTHAYHLPEPLSSYESGLGTEFAPRQTTPISCRYCSKRKMRCSGQDSVHGGKCSNCSRKNQECIFSDTKPVSTLAPTQPILGAVPLRGDPYASFGEQAVQAQHHNRAMSSYRYRASPDLNQDYYTPHSTYFLHPLDRPGGYRGYPLPSYGQRQDESDSDKYYEGPSKSLQEIPSSLSDKQANGFGDSYYDPIEPINPESGVDDHDVLQAWKNQSATRPEKLVPILRNRQLKNRRAIPSLPLPQDLTPRYTAASLEPLQDHDRKYRNLGGSSPSDLRAKLTKPTQTLKTPIELPDPARLSIRSPTHSSSPTVSSDIDVDSISGDSEVQLDRNSQGYYIFSRIFSHIAIRTQNEVTGRGETSSSSSEGNQAAKGGSGTSSKTGDMRSAAVRRKTQRQGDDPGDESRDRQNEPPKKKGKTSQPHCDERSQFLACPYWKADPKKYWDCFLKKNDTIAHLKQHLTRRHTPKYYCQICYQTFRDFDLFDSHALARSCTRGPSAKLEGISQQQKNQLSLKSKGSVEQQWYTVWSILFPRLEPPATIYIYSTESEDFCRIQEYAQREGVVIMLDELESNGLVVRPDASNQQLRSTVQRAMVSIFRSYSNGRGLSSEAEEPILSQAAEPDHGVSLQQEPTTEGQIGHGNHPTNCTDVNRMAKDGRDSAMIGRLDRPSRSTWSQLPTTTPWLPRGVVQDDTGDELWGTAFLDDPAFGESSSGNNLALNFESSDMLDLDALLRDVISTEA